MPILSPLFPDEIVSDIVSYLEQSDIVECMRVNHEWYTVIPKLAAAPWQQLDASSTSWTTTSDPMLQCLYHVRSVYIVNREVCSVLHRLKSKNCAMNSLVIERNILEEDDNVMKFPEALQLFSNTLTQLSITGYACEMAPTQLLDNFPLLTHLTLLSDSGRMPVTLHQQNTELPRLIYLCLGVGSKSPVIPLLRRCPNLKSLCLIKTETSTQRDEEVDDPFLPEHDLDTALDVCPQLRCIIWRLSDAVYAAISQYKQMAIRACSDTVNGDSIRAFVFMGDYNRLSQVTPALKRSQQQLECLSICNLSDDPTLHSLLQIPFPRLKILELTNVKMPLHTYVNWFSGFEDLESIEMLLPSQLVSMDSLLDVLSRLQHLRYLSLTGWSRHELLEDDTPIDIRKIAKCVGLKVLRLFYVRMSDEGLISLASLPLLQDLFIHMEEEHDQDISNDAMMGFADQLIAARSRLETVVLIGLQNMNDAFLERLGLVTCLKRVIILQNYGITDAGLEALVKSGKRAEAYNCTFVSRQGVWLPEESNGTLHRAENAALVP